jgi:nucleoside-diphosphate-sugar epimerase
VIEGPWLVTGASGFLGRHLLQEIEASSPTRWTIALVRDPDEWRQMEWTRTLERVRPLEGSVTETGEWATDERLDGLTGIFHLAALVRHCREDAEEVHRTNVQGTLNMVRLAAARRCRIIFVSTSGTVGCFRQPGTSPDEDAPYCEAEISAWPYYRSKLVAERDSRRLANELGVELVIVRPPVLLGPGDHRFRSTNHVTRFLRGKLPFLIRGGMHFADVRDAAGALVRAMERPEVRPVYHLPGTISTIEEFYALAASAAGRPAPRLILPFRTAWWLAKLTRPFKLMPEPALVEMASRHWSMQSRYAAADLDYRSRPGQDTMAETVAWLRANHPELAPSRRKS